MGTAFIWMIFRTSSSVPKDPKQLVFASDPPPLYYIKLCNECCTQQQPQLPHPCEEDIQISSFLSWNFQSTNPKKYKGCNFKPKTSKHTKASSFL
jgi:hypothetical protein